MIGISLFWEFGMLATKIVKWVHCLKYLLNLICKCTFKDNLSISLIFTMIQFEKLKFITFSDVFAVEKNKTKYIYLKPNILSKCLSIYYAILQDKFIWECLIDVLCQTKETWQYHVHISAAHWEKFRGMSKCAVLIVPVWLPTSSNNEIVFHEIVILIIYVFYFVLIFPVFLQLYITYCWHPHLWW